MAAAGKKNGVRQFVATRAFVRRLKADFANTPFSTVDYNPDYLTQEEKILVGRKVAEDMAKSK